ncbi:molecular chaperone HtpG [Bdellovibrio sp. HCB337]|uniref:molecular chaperone HtpG n=1 Tax=Bdellovibrio sp. HCB337 TaxID=3394358 RepID=UPI0039A6F7B9
MAKQTQAFNAEIKQLLDLMIHSLYSHKEIFLRELVSNASDALDKIKFQSLTQDNLMTPGTELMVRLEPNKEHNTLKITDNGIGMSPEEVVEYIGTIARSGTKKFAQLNQELKERPELIGQFGVGFYSSFMVADKVTLHTQKAGTHSGTLWESKGDGTYTIDEIPRAEGHGTSITLHLKKFEADEEVQDFTDVFVLKSLVKKYSDFIAYPIRMKGETEDETLNSQKALWLKSPSEITKEEYKEFYHHLSHDWNDPIKTIHYKAEGTMEFNALLYIPTQKPWNFNMRDTEYGLNLYIKRVFIMADCKDLLPPYLRFVKGLVDSSDLSLNVSREILQQDRQVTQIRKSVVNKLLGGLKDMLTKERGMYEMFWNEFGATLKEGFPGDMPNKEKLQELVLFKSTASDGWTTLEEYIGRMKEGQKDIYFMTGDDLGKMMDSPYLEKLKEKNYEVLLMADPIDEWVTDSLREYKEKKLQSVTKEDLNLDTEEEKKKKEEETKGFLERFKPLLESMKDTLKDQVKDVNISERLTETPVCLVAGSHDPSAHMQKILSQMGQDKGLNAKRIFEINPKHPVIEKMMSLSADQQKLWTEVLYSQALLNEGSSIPDPKKFSKQLAELMLKQ